MGKMRNIYIFMLIVLMANLAPVIVSAKVTARVDRESMAVDETLSLTIEKDGASFFTRPDLEPLARDFRVEGQSQSSSTQIINGSSSSSAQWRIVLSPLHTGELTIPPLTVGGEQTNSLTVQVRDAAPPGTSADSRPIFVETEVEADWVYVQAQVLFTLRLYWAVEARVADPPDPEIAGALVKRLDDTTYAKVRDGQRYKVFERKYAVFPQQSGTLEIPSIGVEVTVPSQPRSGLLFDPFGMIGETIKLRSDSEKVEVRERPASYPSTAAWLPAANLQLAVKWSVDPQGLKVGDSATMTLTMSVDGLTGEQLPPIELPASQGLKVYQGKGEVTNETTPRGVQGVRTESIALIPTRAGTYSLPEIRIPWWNTSEEKIAYAVVPSSRVRVTGAPAVSDAGDTPSSSQQAAPAQTRQRVETPQSPPSRPTAWILLSSCLALGWLATLFLLLQRRGRGRLAGRRHQGGVQEGKEQEALQEKQAFAALAAACRENNPAAARKRVMSWLAALQPKERLQTLSDVERLFPDSAFLQQLRELDRYLFHSGAAAGEWYGAGLLEQAEAIRRQRKRTQEKSEVLEQLYK